MRSYGQCEIFGVPPFGRFGHWGHFGPHRMGFEEIMFGPGPFNHGHGSRHGGPFGRYGFWHHGPSGHHRHHGHHADFHGPDHSSDMCERRSRSPEPPGHHSSESPDRCRRSSPGRHGPPGRGPHHGPASPEKCGHRSPWHYRFPVHHGHGLGHTPGRSDGPGEHCSCGPWHAQRRHRRGLRHKYECDHPRSKCCKRDKRPGRCCGDASDSDNARKSGNETCDRGTLTDIFPGKAFVIKRFVVKKAPRCYSV